MTACSLRFSIAQKLASFLRLHRAYWIFTTCAALYLLPFMPLLLNCGDEGSIVYAAVRVTHGQIFARDFFEVMGPGSVYFLALFFRIFGISFWASRLNLFLTSLGISVLMYFLTRRICTRHRLVPSLILAATSFGLSWPAVTHHLHSNLFSLIAIAFVVVWHERGHLSLLVATGASTAIVALIHQPKGIFLLIAIALYLFTVSRERGRRLQNVLALSLGFLVIGAIVLIFFWHSGAIHNLYYANIIWPLSHYGAVNSVPYAQQLISGYWNRWSFKSGSLDPLMVVAAVFISPILLIAALPIILPILAWLAGFHKPAFWHNASPLLPLYCLCGSALWLSEIHRMDITHLQFGSLLLIVVFVYQLSVIHHKWSECAMKTLAFLCILVAAVNATVVLAAARPTSTNVGTVTMLANDPVIPFLCSHVTPGQDVFIYPYRPMDYFLSATNNPTRYSLLVYNYNTDDEFRDAVHSLELQRPHYVVWNTRFEDIYGAYLPTSHRLNAHNLIMEPYLQAHYSVSKIYNEYTILTRKQDDHER
jgi:4-amino-4-deoxy-L-arabinose transferase-like glycosyltransferase